MDISYEGIGQTCITLRRRPGVSVGCACTMDGANIVDVAGDEYTITGIATAVRGDYVSLMIHGIVTMPYTGSAPGIGYCPLCGDGTGKVKYSLEGINYHVLEVDQSAHTVTFIL